MPWYLIGHFLTLPCFYLVFNPPDFAVGLPPDDAPEGTLPTPNLWYFLLVPGLMNIGQGAIQLSHMSIVNSITYDQKRRDMMINFRNSCSYFSGIFLPTVSFIMFTNFEDENT